MESTDDYINYPHLYEDIKVDEEQKVKKTLKISGTYGDKVKLRLDGGYVGTKYDDTARIKSVDIENSTVHTYLHGSFDFSRIACSYKVSEQADKEYLDCIKRLFYNRNIRIGSILETIEDEIKRFTVEDIIYPNMVDVFEPMIKFTFNCDILENSSSVILIQDMDDFSRKYVSVFCPFTYEEELSNLLAKHLKFGKIENSEKYIKELVEFNKNFTNKEIHKKFQKFQYDMAQNSLKQERKVIIPLDWLENNI